MMEGKKALTDQGCLRKLVVGVHHASWSMYIPLLLAMTIDSETFQRIPPRAFACHTVHEMIQLGHYMIPFQHPSGEAVLSIQY